MTDKQIIEYKHIKCTRDDCCHYCGSVFCGYVDDIENLEKAYKAKEQECEELKEKVKKYGEINEQETKDYADLKAENDKLRFPMPDTNYAILTKEEFEQLDQLKAENENFKSLIYWLHYGAIDAERVISEYYENRNTPYEENFWKRIRALQPCKYESKYKTALAEIKEIAEKTYKTPLAEKDCIKCDEFLQQILQKISEVVDETINN